MRRTRLHLISAAFVAICLASCAGTSDVYVEAEVRQAQISAILREPLPVGFEPSEPRRCLSNVQFRRYRALDDRHLLFEGRRGELWVNTLRQRCPDLRFGDVLVVRSFSTLRLCDLDRFQVTDWFRWPWYRRWPWRWGQTWHTGMTCTLGRFQPVTEGQVAEIRGILRSR